MKASWNPPVRPADAPDVSAAGVPARLADAKGQRLGGPDPAASNERADRCVVPRSVRGGLTHEQKDPAPTPRCPRRVRRPTHEQKEGSRVRAARNHGTRD